MAFKPNYNQQRAERNRAKEQKKKEKLQRKEEEVARRKGLLGDEPEDGNAEGGDTDGDSPDNRD